MTPDETVPPRAPAGSVPPRAPAGLPPWPEILAAALVGTRRRPLPPAGPVLAVDPAVALLDAAAAVGSYRRAGELPAAVAPPGDPAPAGDAPPVPVLAELRGAELLGYPGGPGPLRDAATRLELLVEWLGLVAAAGRRVPGELVPALLDIGRRHRAVRPLIGPAAGPLAAWLAAQRPEWGYHRPPDRPAAAPPGDPEHVWELGDATQRARWLAARREQDPDGARDLLTAAWDRESPDDRATLLGALATGLAPADEPLLERALDDRRKEVRATAADLLLTLPTSGYVRRMVARATSYLDVGGPDGRIRVRPPTSCDRSMRRDGITARPPGGVGERAWWLEETLARTPLATWAGPPGELLRRPVSDDWQAVLHRGFARAAATQRDPQWAAELAVLLTARVAAGRRPDDRLLLEAVYDVLPSELLAARALVLLRYGLVRAAAVGVEHLLELCPRPWPPEVAQAFVDALAEAVASRDAGWRVTGVCEVAALRLDTGPGEAGGAPGAGVVEAVAALADRLRSERPSDSATTIVNRLATTLRYRRQMSEELT